MKKGSVLITGGAGYIGSHTVRLLCLKGYQVVVLDNLVYGHEGAILDESAELVVGDVGDRDLLTRLFTAHDFIGVIHFAIEHIADNFSQKTFGLKPTTCEQRLKVVLTIFRATSARTKQETLLAWQTLDHRQKYYLAIHPYCSIKMSSNTFSKAAIRKKIRLRLKQLNRLEIAEASLDILSQLKFPDGSRVAIFAGLSCEPQLLELIVSQPNVKWHLPKVSGPGKMDFLRFEKIEDLSLGAFRILEPDHGVKATHLDFMICPGVAFTREGHRLGQGGGFYDRAISRFPKTKIIGVGFECQVVDQLPIDKHDCPMDQIIIAPMGT